MALSCCTAPSIECGRSCAFQATWQLCVPRQAAYQRRKRPLWVHGRDTCLIYEATHAPQELSSSDLCGVVTTVEVVLGAYPRADARCWSSGSTRRLQQGALLCVQVRTFGVSRHRRASERTAHRRRRARPLVRLVPQAPMATSWPAHLHLGRGRRDVIRGFKYLVCSSSDLCGVLTAVGSRVRR